MRGGARPSHPPHTLRTLRSKVREKEIADGASTVSFVTTLSSYFLTDFPSNLICSFMVWVRCRAEPCKLDGSTAQTIGTNLGRVAERERSVGGGWARAHPHPPQPPGSWNLENLSACDGSVLGSRLAGVG